MIKQFKHLLLFIVISGLQLYAATKYTVGIETDGTRVDSLLMGSASGFNDFRNPSNTCKELYINLEASASQPDPNNIPTNSYTGTGAVPYLPDTLKHLYILGDASYFDTMVLGNTRTGDDAPIYSSAAYALPTPAAGTTIHFSLRNPPASNPLTWFQAPIPANCKLVIELQSADPSINTMLPLKGGYIIIGAPISFPHGFSDLLNSATKPVIIQRHPLVNPNNAYIEALVTLYEAVVFKWSVWGISLGGDYLSEFDEDSEIVDPSAAAANAGFLVASKKKLSIYSRDHSTLPEIASSWEEGGASTTITKTPAPLPITSVIPS